MPTNTEQDEKEQTPSAEVLAVKDAITEGLRFMNHSAALSDPMRSFLSELAIGAFRQYLKTTDQVILKKGSVPEWMTDVDPVTVHDSTGRAHIIDRLYRLGWDDINA